MEIQKISISRLILTIATSLLATGMSTCTLAQAQTSDQVRNQPRDQTQDRIRDQDRLRDPIYGSQLMTPQERSEHQNKMSSLKTEQEREAYRIDHHNQMQERAKVQGVTLPKTPPNQSTGMGRGPR
jgi:hypothetical protein